MSFLLRVVLPDKPGSLGAVATALGNAGADILGVNVVERSTGHAVDDLAVELPSGRPAGRADHRGRVGARRARSSRCARTSGSWTRTTSWS